MIDSYRNNRNRSNSKGEKKILKRKRPSLTAAEAETAASSTATPLAPLADDDTNIEAAASMPTRTTIQSLSTLFRQHAELLTLQSNMLDIICSTSTPTSNILSSTSFLAPPSHPLVHTDSSKNAATETIQGNEQDRGNEDESSENVENSGDMNGDCCHVARAKVANEEIESSIKELGGNQREVEGGSDSSSNSGGVARGDVMDPTQVPKTSNVFYNERLFPIDINLNPKHEQHQNDDNLKILVNELFSQIEDKSEITVKQFRLLLEDTYNIKLDKMNKKKMKDYLTSLIIEDHDSY